MMEMDFNKNKKQKKKAEANITPKIIALWNTWI